jgi:orotidine-5'-phosphate decarboxylase
MLEAAYEAYAKLTWEVPSLIGVTVLTSMDEGQLEATGISVPPADHVQRLAKLCADSGLDGVVCSAQEAESLREQHGPRFQLVTPGIRPEGSSQDDQVRIVTPAQAIANGASHLVIGRPITQSVNPEQTLKEIIASVS